MGFIDSYKCLEKLCGEVLNVEKGGVTEYIDAMTAIANGEAFVQSWRDDLKALKHYRWIRNQIAHEPDCNEENMCRGEDAAWLESFRARIMNQTDPIAMYRKAVKARTHETARRAPVPQRTVKRQAVKKVEQTPCEEKSGCLKLVLGVLLVFAIVLMFYLELRPHNL